MRKITVKDIEKCEIKLELVDKYHYKGTLTHPKLGTYFYNSHFEPSTEGMEHGSICINTIHGETLVNAEGESFYTYDLDDDTHQAYSEKLDEAQMELLSKNKHLYPELNWED